VLSVSFGWIKAAADPSRSAHASSYGAIFVIGIALMILAVPFTRRLSATP
jgi:hypothetical protein